MRARPGTGGSWSRRARSRCRCAAGTRRLLGPGEGFGEIALLRDVPRTATVTAVAPQRCLTLDREDLLAVVTGHPESAVTAHRSSESLLALDPR